MILDAISRETYGSQFVAYANKNGKIRIERKESNTQFLNKPVRDVDAENPFNFI